MNLFKRLFYISLILLVHSCQELTTGPINSDSTPPAPVTGVEVKSIPGGAKLSYVPPDDKDLLYVKAVFTTKEGGQQKEVKASLYENQMTIEGFGDTLLHQVMLYAVDRGENVSEPISVNVKPLKPPFQNIFETLEITEDFGGARFSWENTFESPVAIILLAPDSLQKMSIYEMVYTSELRGTRSIRGFDPEKQKFAVLIRDRWDNYSDTLTKEIIPMYEEEMDKSKFQPVYLANDNEWDAWEGEFEYIYDDDLETFNHTAGGTGWPQQLTIDLGVTVKLSRYKLWQRQGGYSYKHGNFKKWEIYGRADVPEDDGSWDNWKKLMVCDSYKPSGLPIGQETNEDLAHMKAGDEFTFDLEGEPVRYIRIRVLETWSGATFSHMAEISFYGQIVE
ncbi:DUF5000 domain-containing lipoprotein [Rapidithrix thailandica]|uniref:DUF5000 domain-containing lipoprotein n=1 Tax=Rapidithrix thailandica TaxID=413964 RepID=A0AAW9S8H6_9BACT